MARSVRGVMHIRLLPLPDGIYVEREQEFTGGGHIVESMIFHDAEEFARWCDGDKLRFEHPTVHVDVKRHADSFLQHR
jgi:uncharacterized Zn-finger protein